MKFRTMTLALLCCLVHQAALAKVDTAKSSVTATLTQMNVPVDGRFRQISADVAFDPSHPEAGMASIVIDTASYDLGDESFNGEARGSAWFDTASWRHATFHSTGIKRTGANTFDMSGQLTIKGTTTAVVVPVKYSQQGSNQIFDGTVPVHRSQFKVGTGEWADTSVVADLVQVRFHIVNAR